MQGRLPSAATSLALGESDVALLSIWDWWDLWVIARNLPGWSSIDGVELSASWVPAEPALPPV